MECIAVSVIPVVLYSFTCIAPWIQLDDRIQEVSHHPTMCTCVPAWSVAVAMITVALYPFLHMHCSVDPPR